MKRCVWTTVCLLLYAVYMVSGECSTSTSIGIPDTISGPVAEGATVTCVGFRLFQSQNYFSIFAYCIDDEWVYSPSDAKCSSQYKMLLPCMSYNPSATFTNTGSQFTHDYVACKSNDTALASGHHGRFVQCLSSSWTDFTDVCINGCAIPRDCSHLASMSVKASQLYRMSPAGSHYDTNAILWCEMNDTTRDGGGWMTLMRHFRGNSDLQVGMADYEMGIGDPSNTWIGNSSYFIGLKTWRKLIQNSIGQYNPIRSFIYQIIMTDVNDTVYHATYEDIHLNETNGLSNVGNYHGNAGNLFQFHNEEAFVCWDSGCWWDASAEKATNLSSIEPYWGDLLLKSVHIRARTKEFDMTVACPLLNVKERTWTTTEMEVPLSRSLGTVLEFQCVGQIMISPHEGSDVKSAAVECELPPNKELQWNATINLPCTGTCPDEFVLNNEANRCFHLSNDTAELGVIEAVLRCSELEASLATLEADMDYLLPLMELQLYYTGYTKRGEMEDIWPNMTSDLVCDGEPCEVDDDNGCIATTNSSFNYTAVPCSHLSDAGYMCMLPPKCPDNFKEHKGLCYWLIETQRNFMDALRKCNEDGGALAYPPSMDDLSAIIDKFKDEILELGLASNTRVTQPVSIMIGINHVGEELVGVLDYTLDESITDLINESSPWQVAVVDVDSGNITLEGAPLEGNLAKGAICQHIGPIGCTDEPWIVLDGTDDWNDTHLYLGAEATYTCFPGYFADGKIYVTKQTTKCFGQLGGWLPEPLPCLAADVCLDKFPELPSPKMTKVTSQEFRHLNGTVKITCPNGMATQKLLTKQTITCIQLDGEYVFAPKDIMPCDVCLSELVVTNGTSEWDGNGTYKVGTLVSATCNDGFRSNFREKDLVANCTEDGWQVSEQCYEACDDPSSPGERASIENYTSDAVGSLFTYACQEGFYFPLTPDFPDISSTGIMECSSNMNDTALVWTPENHPLKCVNLCVNDPPTTPPMANSSWDLFSRETKTEIQYQCPDGMLFGDLKQTWTVTCEVNGNWTTVDPDSFICRKPATSAPPPPAGGSILILVDKGEKNLWEDSSVNYTCGEAQMSPTGVTFVISTFTNGNWTEIDPDFECRNICTLEPPVAPMGVISNFSGIPFWGTVVLYNCTGDFLFYDYTRVDTVTCEKGKWNKMELQKVLDDLPELLVSPGENVTISPPPPYPMNSSYNCTCPPGKFYITGKNYVTVTRTPKGWVGLDPDDICLDICLEKPHSPSANITSNNTGVAPIGTVIEYRCKGIFHGGGRILYNKCQEDGTWSLFYLPYCMNVDPNAPQPPPTTAAPPKFPNSDVRTQAYNITTDAYMPSLEKFTENAGDESVQFILTDGPFGFGYAVDLTASNKECMKRSPYPEINKCPKDPANCPKGMSMGIWERTNISYDVFNTVHKLHEEPKRYVISTGGDELGHPGIAIYHQGLALIAIFSTGDQYWKLEVLGPIENTEWNNIGIRWIPKNGNEGGLEMYINARKVGQQHLSVESTPKAALDPVELLIGCHRDADDMEYRGYSDADFDEFAAWKRRLSDEDTVLYLGGFEGEVENLDPEEFGLMLGRTNLKDPKQAAIAMAMLSSMMGAELDQLNAPIDPNATAEATDTATDSGNSTEIPLSPRAQRLCSMVFAVSKVFTSGVKDDLTRDEMQGYMEIVGAASQMLDESIAEVWEELEDSECSGANDFRKDLETYMKSLVTSFKLDKDSPPMNYTKITDNVVATVQKFNSKNCNSIKNKFITPNFTESREMRNLRVELNFPLDKMEVNKAVYCDPGCKDHTISLFSFYYLSFAEVGPKKINEEAMNEKVMNKIDGKVMSIDIISEPPKKPKPPKPSDPKCHSVAKNLEKHPIVTRLEHEVKIASLRSLSFHQDEISSLISKRYCVWWNFDVGETGSWDPEGCSLLATNELYTKCACSQLGIFAIMSEYVEERELPPEAYWVTMIKYIGCIISALCIIFYILVVALAGDLKDHFHVSGLCLAGCVLLGSIFLLVSDLESVRDGRHACTAMGSLIHGFYLAAAAFTAMVGHAGFKAVTGGIIGGRMTPYMMISWGVTLISIGFSVLFFLHELGTDPRCFISWFDEIKYIFFLPLMMCVSVAVFFVVVIFFNVRHAKKIYNTSMSIFGSFITGSTVVILYFSITWIFGFFAYIRWMEAYALYPLFHIMNSFMGVVILLGLGLSSSKFRGVLAGQAKKRREMMQNFNPRNKAKKLDNKTSPPPPSRSSQPPPPVPTELGGNK